MEAIRFFQTIHHEEKPIGRLDGIHYSVYRAPVWHSEALRPLGKAHVLDFAVLWDEDHDERVLQVASRLWIEGQLPAVRFIHERKAILTVLVDSKALTAMNPAVRGIFSGIVSASCRDLHGDTWHVEVHPVDGKEWSTTIRDRSRAETYIRNIDNMWGLGVKPI